MGYEVFFSTVALLNGVFVGLFVTFLFTRDHIFGGKDALVYVIAVAWFGVGCVLPMQFMLDGGDLKHTAHVYLDATAFVFPVALSWSAYMASRHRPMHGKHESR